MASDSAVTHPCITPAFSASRMKENFDFASSVLSLAGVAWKTKTRLPARDLSNPWSASDASSSSTRTEDAAWTRAIPLGFSAGSSEVKYLSAAVPSIGSCQSSKYRRCHCFPLLNAVDWPFFVSHPEMTSFMVDAPDTVAQCSG